MNVIIPIPTTQTTLDSSNVAASSEAAWAVGTSYTYGDIVVRDYNGLPYTFMFLNTGSIAGYDPAIWFIDDITNYTTDEYQDNYKKWWLKVGPTNKYAMFSQHGSIATTNATSIAVSVTPGVFFNAISFVNLVADTIQVTVTDPTEGLVYDSGEISLMDLTGITDHYRWYFYQITNESKASFSIAELPPYPNATIAVTATNTGDTAEIGEMVVGISYDIGKWLYGSAVGCVDYSDSVPGSYYQQIDYLLNIPTADLNEVNNLLASLMGVPAVFVGDETRQESIIYGLRSQFTISIDGPVISQCTLQVKETK